MIPDIITKYIFIKCNDDLEFKQANEYLNSIDIKYYSPSKTRYSEEQKDYNSYIYLTEDNKNLFMVHYDLKKEVSRNNIIYTWSYIKEEIGYKDFNIDEIISNLDKLEDKYK